jgi:tRNA U34 2-thiouridine synthase MnmA/TrmU
VGLLSGGLDSTLAAKLIQDQGTEVIAFNFRSPFYKSDQKGRSEAAEAASKFNIPLKVAMANTEYLKMLLNPKHGYRSGMNPCIDCKILMLKKAKQFAKGIGAKFLFTGEVLDQRPMSQHRKALDIIEKEADLEGKILRPLSAKLLPPTEAENKGWVDRTKLPSIKGRSRKPQIALASTLGVFDYPSPAGGCLLTEKEFAARLRDLINHKRNIIMKDVAILKVGRHFRFEKNKMIIGRNEEENRVLLNLNDRRQTYLEVQDCGSPVTVLQGRLSKKALAVAARLTARYSDSKSEETLVSYRQGTVSGNIKVRKMSEDEVSALRISST